MKKTTFSLQSRKLVKNRMNHSTSKTNSWLQKDDTMFQSLLPKSQSSKQEKNFTPTNSCLNSVGSNENLSHIEQKERCSNQFPKKNDQNLKIILFSPLKKVDQIRINKISSIRRDSSKKKNLRFYDSTQNGDSGLNDHLNFLQKKNLSIVSDLSFTSNPFFDCSKSSIAKNEIVSIEPETEIDPFKEKSYEARRMDRRDGILSQKMAQFGSNNKEIIYKNCHSHSTSSLQISDLKIELSKGNSQYFTHDSFNNDSFTDSIRRLTTNKKSQKIKEKHFRLNRNTEKKFLMKKNSKNKSDSQLKKYFSKFKRFSKSIKQRKPFKIKISQNKKSNRPFLNNYYKSMKSFKQKYKEKKSFSSKHKSFKSKVKKKLKEFNSVYRKKNFKSNARSIINDKENRNREKFLVKKGNLRSLLKKKQKDLKRINKKFTICRNLKDYSKRSRKRIKSRNKKFKFANSTLLNKSEISRKFANVKRNITRSSFWLTKISKTKVNLF